MTSIRLACGAMVLALALAGSPLPCSAQGVLGGLTGRSPVQIAPYAGGIWFSEMGEVEANLFSSGGVQGRAPDRVTSLELRTESAPMFGVSVGWSVAPSLDLRLNGALAVTEFDLAGVSAAPGDALTSFTTVGGLADVYVTLLGVDGLWRLAGPGRTLSPYAVIGTGLVIWDLNALNDFATVEPLTRIGFDPVPRTEVELVGSLGLGMDVRLGGRASLRLEVVDHIGTNPIHSADFVRGADFTGSTDAEDLVNAVRVSAGIAVGLGK